MQNTSMHFGATKSRNGVNFSCNFGEILSDLGENGADKSTLMELIEDAWRHINFGVIIIVMLLFQTLRKGVYL